MPDIEGIPDKPDKIDWIERARQIGPPLFVQYLVSPLLVLVIGLFVIREVRQNEAAFRQLELDVRQIEAAQDTFAELLPAIVESAFAADRLKSEAPAANNSKGTSATRTAPDSKRPRRQLLEKGPSDVKGIAAAAETIDGPAAAAGGAPSDEKRYYIVVASAARENRDNAVKRAEELRVKGYRSAVRDTESGNLVVTLGPVPKGEAQLVLADAVLRRDVKGDSFLSEGKTFTKQIFPR